MSTGLAGLDAALRGGAPLGSVLALEAGPHARAADAVARLFVAEGAACGHACFWARADGGEGDASVWWLPPPRAQRPPRAAGDGDAGGVAPDLKIAWQYRRHIASARAAAEAAERGAPRPPRAPGAAAAALPAWCHEFDVGKPCADPVPGVTRCGGDAGAAVDAAVAAARAARGAATGAAADRARHAAAALCAQREAQGWSLVPVTVLVGSEGGGGGDRRPFAVAAHPVAPPTAAADLRAATKAAARLFRQRLQVQLVAGGRVVARGPAAGVGEDYSIPLACTLTATLPSPPTKVALRLVRVRGRWWWPRARAQRVASVAVSPAASPSAVDALAHRPWERGAWAGTLGAAVGLEVAV